MLQASVLSSRCRSNTFSIPYVTVFCAWEQPHWSPCFTEIAYSLVEWRIFGLGVKKAGFQFQVCHSLAMWLDSSPLRVFLFSFLYKQFGLRWSLKEFQALQSHVAKKISKSILCGAPTQFAGVCKVFAKRTLKITSWPWCGERNSGISVLFFCLIIPSAFFFGFHFFIYKIKSLSKIIFSCPSFSEVL